MECSFPSRGVKLFAKMIQSMSKIGEDLFLEAQPDLFIARTLNGARSAFSVVKYEMGFFDTYFFDKEGGPPIKINVLLKTCVNIFRSLSTLEKTVNKCTIRIDTHNKRLIINLSCKHSITKSYRLTYEERDTLQAVYDKNLSQHLLEFRPRLITDSLTNFHSLEEITLIVSTKHVRIKSYIDAQKESDAAKTLHTELALRLEDFEKLSLSDVGSAQITFTLKEFRAVMSFFELAGGHVRCHFDSGGAPVIFTQHLMGVMEADVVMATILEAPPRAPSSSQGSVASSTSRESTPTHVSNSGQSTTTSYQHSIRPSQGQPANSQQSLSQPANTPASRPAHGYTTTAPAVGGGGGGGGGAPGYNNNNNNNKGKGPASSPYDGTVVGSQSTAGVISNTLHNQQNTATGRTPAEVYASHQTTPGLGGSGMNRMSGMSGVSGGGGGGGGLTGARHAFSSPADARAGYPASGGGGGSNMLMSVGQSPTVGGDGASAPLSVPDSPPASERGHKRNRPSLSRGGDESSEEEFIESTPPPAKRPCTTTALLEAEKAASGGQAPAPQHTAYDTHMAEASGADLNLSLGSDVSRITATAPMRDDEIVPDSDDEEIPNSAPTSMQVLSGLI